MSEWPTTKARVSDPQKEVRLKAIADAAALISYLHFDLRIQAGMFVAFGVYGEPRNKREIAKAMHTGAP